MFGLKIIIALCVISPLISGVLAIQFHPEESRPNGCVKGSTELINEEETVLYLSTLNGTFIGVNHGNGETLWQFEEEAAVKAPNSTPNALSPIFLPDPRDGSLYLLDSENRCDLKKLQFTIQQLVTSSPCRSSDGTFYSGKKIDNWFMIDWRTGSKEVLFNSDNVDRVCPLMSRTSMFVGRTEYNLMIHDVTRKQSKVNVTFYDYSAEMLSPDKIKSQGHLYFAGSSTGKFAVFKSAEGGSFLWEADFGSPVIGVYLREGDRLVALPFTTVDETSMPFNGLESIKQVKFSSTLYVGTHTHGLYALPALSNSDTTILLLNGPEDTISVPVVNEDQSAALLGYYKIPQGGIKRLLITGRRDAIIDMNDTVYGINSSTRLPTETISMRMEESEPLKSLHMFHYLVHVGFEYLSSTSDMELKVFMGTVLSMIVCMFVYFREQIREFKQTSCSEHSRISNSSNTDVTATAEELSDGSTKVGKITFNSSEILGKGCEGTFVFKGEFDNRPVAVKRLLPECFTVADREVRLLRESDQHPNVVRYFSMEQDRQFRYIALELCSATLQDYTEQGIFNDVISPTEVLCQAAAGLEHLHALRIVHRDIKPHNVLLSFPSTCSNETKIRVMISDFGLCKKLKTGKTSFSRKSGVTGTDGWIAPEMIDGKNRTTAAVDVFSLGCVFYYVLSGGKHPFGESLSRQANIMNGMYKRISFTNDEYGLWSHLIARMISFDPLERPAVSVVKKHPAFWTKDQALSFLQDVSDRIEKEDVTSKVLLELEMGNSIVLKGDWRDQIEKEIAVDLRKYRNYRADSVRDLLRALRNKKHHYRELSYTVQSILGSIPDEFVKYWLDRFPNLLLHTWLAMQCVNHETLLQKYYSNIFKYPSIHNGLAPSWIQPPSPRWKMSNKNGNSPKFGTRFSSGDKGNTPFFTMSNSGEKSAYNWRHRPKTASEGSEPEKGVESLAVAVSVQESFATKVETFASLDESVVTENECVMPVEKSATQKVKNTSVVKQVDPVLSLEEPVVTIVESVIPVKKSASTKVKRTQPAEKSVDSEDEPAPSKQKLIQPKAKVARPKQKSVATKSQASVLPQKSFVTKNETFVDVQESVIRKVEPADTVDKCENQENVKPTGVNEQLKTDESHDGEGIWQTKTRHRPRAKRRMVQWTLPVRS